MTRNELENAAFATMELYRRRARTQFRTFVQYIKDDYDMQWFHRYICDRLDAFAAGEVKKMMILLPPQHGKSELATRMFPAYLLGRNPDLRIAIASYGDSIASGFNRAIQRNIDTEKYGFLYPETKLNSSKVFGTNYDNYVRTDHKFEIVTKKGSVKTVGRGGSLTSEPVDIGIIDDLYKDREEAKSLVVSESAWQWYVDVFLTRLHNNSQQLIMNTRWDDKDLAGRLLKKEKDEWEVIVFPAIRTKDQCSYDPRPEGEALWPQKHSLDKIKLQKELSEVSFNSLYQQDPKPDTSILIYTGWIKLETFPEEIGPYTWGLDFGKTTGINALVKCATIGQQDAYVKECMYAANAPVSAIIECLYSNGYNPDEIVWCDHIPQKIQELRLNGICAMPAVKGAGSVSSGIDKIREYRMHYWGESIHFEYCNYQKVAYGDFITNVPVDENNHAMDAIRYGLLSRYFRGR